MKPTTAMVYAKTLKRVRAIDVALDHCLSPSHEGVEPGRGIEPRTYSLRVNRSAD